MVDFLLRHFGSVITTREQAHQVLLIVAIVGIVLSVVLWYRTLATPITPPPGMEGNYTGSEYRY